AEAADGGDIAVELVGCAGHTAWADEGGAVEVPIGCRVGYVAAAQRIGPLGSARRRPRTRGIAAAHGGGQERAGLKQQNAAEAPSAGDRIHQGVHAAAEFSRPAERQLKYRRSETAMAPHRSHI